MKLDVIPCYNAIDVEQLAGKTAIVIDVLRATSTITVALANGARDVIVVDEVSEALSLRGNKVLIGGERDGLKISGFDLSNSPQEYTPSVVGSMHVVLTTSNGTRTINKSLVAADILIACILNAKSVAKQAVKLGKDICLVCAGSGGEFAYDDFLCAGKIVSEIIIQASEITMLEQASAAKEFYNSHKSDLLKRIRLEPNYTHLESIGFRDDVEFCFREDILSVVPRYYQGRLIANAGL